VIDRARLIWRIELNCFIYMNPITEHPELQKGEVFFGNFTKQKIPGIGWEYKRVGKTPYDKYGKKIKDRSIFPVFVKKKELKSDGLDVKKLDPFRKAPQK
jgi:hypothetical protein